MDFSLVAMNPPYRSLVAAIILFFAALPASWGVSAAMRAIYQRKKSSVGPGAQGLLDGTDPGNTAMARINQLYLDGLFLSGHLIALPMLLCTAYWTLIIVRPEFNQLVGVIAAGGQGLLFSAIVAVKLARCRRQYQSAVLAFENKRSTGQALAHLVDQGYHIYHDLEKGPLCVDHLVVGAKGIFAVQVFSCKATANGNKNRGATATYDGRALYYNNVADYETIAQAAQKAEQVSDWATSVLAEPVAARVVVAMPGWTIKRTSPEGFSVVNPGQFKSFFQHIQARPLSESDIAKLVAGIEQAYSKTKM